MKALLKMIFFGLVITGSLQAVPAAPGEMVFEQKDGSTFEGKMVGDEWFGWIEDTKGRTIVFNKKTHNYEFAKLFKEANDLFKLIPSGIPVVTFSQGAPAAMDVPIPEIDKTMLYDIWKQKRTKAHKHTH